MPTGSQVALATRPDDHSRLLEAFRKFAEAHLTGHDRELASTPSAQSQTAAGSVRERAANREV